MSVHNEPYNVPLTFFFYFLKKKKMLSQQSKRLVQMSIFTHKGFTDFSFRIFPQYYSEAFNNLSLLLVTQKRKYLL